MKLFDPKFRKNKWHYYIQTAGAVAVMAATLSLLDAETEGALVASLGASTFIAFTMPHANVSKPRYLIGGYAVGIFSGIVCFRIMTALLDAGTVLPAGVSYVSLFSAASMGMALFLMVVLNLEHPPAAGVALGIVLNQAGFVPILIVASGILLITAAKTALKPTMINLM